MCVPSLYCHSWRHLAWEDGSVRFFLLAEGCLSPPLTRIVDAARDRKNDLLALICSVVSVEEERTSQ